MDTLRYALIVGDCLDVVRSMPDDSIDLIVTSPPYAGKRKDCYDSISADVYSQWLFERSVEFMRVLKPTGSFILNIKEGVDKGVRQSYVLEYHSLMVKRYRWIETFIWNKTNPYPTGCARRLKDGFEYCYQYAKTNKYRLYPQNCLVKSQSKWIESEAKRTNKGKHDVTNGSGMNMSCRAGDKEFVRPSTVFTHPTNTRNVKHPATFPIGLPSFFISLCTEPGDIILDPFVGSGTTLRAAYNLNRNCIGVDISEEYILDANINCPESIVIKGEKKWQR